MLGMRTLSSKELFKYNAKVAVCITKDDSYTDFVLDILKHTDSVRNSCELIETTEEEAVKMLENKEVSMAVVFPGDFINAIVSGMDTQLRFILPKNISADAQFICSVFNAGAKTFSYVQSGLYSVVDYLSAKGHEELCDEANRVLNDQFLKYALNRTFCFSSDNSYFSDSLKNFYIAGGVVICLMLIGTIYFTSFFKAKNETLLMLKTFNVSACTLRLCEVLSITLIFALPLGIAATVVSKSPVSLLFSFVLCFSIAGFILMLRCIFQNDYSGELMICISTLGFMYMSGRILPFSYIPKFFMMLGRFLPTTYFSGLSDRMFFNPRFDSNFFITLAFGAVFFIISYVITVMKGRASR